MIKVDNNEKHQEKQFIEEQISNALKDKEKLGEKLQKLRLSIKELEMGEDEQERIDQMELEMVLKNETS